VIEIFGQEYLRAPYDEDTERFVGENAEWGWPGMFGSLDCMHYRWKNCHVGWKGHYRGSLQRSNNHSLGCCIEWSMDLSFSRWIA
jgi:hypothetical protein